MNLGRLEREKRTLFAMIEIYCRAHHGTRSALCAECEELYQYGLRRLDKCPFQDDKPTCAKCPIHCYNPAMRERVRQVMRFAGPRMLFHHPLLTLRHYLDELLYRKAGQPGGSSEGKNKG
jgi:hypothetical protein